MSAEDDVLKFFENALFMKVPKVGPNVFSYEIDQLTKDLLPCLVIRIESVDKIESSTFKKIHKNITISIDIVTGINSEVFNIGGLFDIREKISSVIESAVKPDVVLDFNEVSASDINGDSTTEENLLKQTMSYVFLTKEIDR